MDWKDRGDGVEGVRKSFFAKQSQFVGRGCVAGCCGGWSAIFPRFRTEGRSGGMIGRDTSPRRTRSSQRGRPQPTERNLHHAARGRTRRESLTGFTGWTGFLWSFIPVILSILSKLFTRRKFCQLVVRRSFGNRQWYSELCASAASGARRVTCGTGAIATWRLPSGWESRTERPCPASQQA